jgi:putative SOS response-associated peptidase YedK
MCNVYSIRQPRAEVVRLFQVARDWNNNQPPMPAVYPDYPAPVIRVSPGGEREMANLRWGLPSPQAALPASGIDRGVTNVRNTGSPHWTRWLEPPSRCLVPFTSFAEPNDANRSENVWMALGEDRPLACFAGLWAPWTCVRKKSEGEVRGEFFGILTTAPNSEVAAIHRQAMPVILTRPEEWEAWLTGPWPVASRLQRRLANGALTTVARGVGLKEDPAELL